ncbi:MAG TPA: hypothetical protein VK464_07075, partial [Symbiobacteriaceae bacterium]|nr:hypothetical protein [Symbiobacteriaceae bacterium]
PGVTTANADGALRKLGLDPHVSCQGDAQPMTYAQGWVLLDRADSVVWYARWPKLQKRNPQ